MSILPLNTDVFPQRYRNDKGDELIVTDSEGYEKVPAGYKQISMAEGPFIVRYIAPKQPKMRYVTWEEIRQKLQMFDRPSNVVYGVPKNGMILAGMLQEARFCTQPHEATIILDDIIDSGETKKKYSGFKNATFHALYNKMDGTVSADTWLVMPWENTPAVNEGQGPRDAVIRLLQHIGEDPKRDGLLETPDRVLKALKEMTAGYLMDPKEILSKVFKADCDEMVWLKNIPFTSLCEHHMLPFTGFVTIAYVPGKSVVGISKLARLVDCFALRLQIQERMTQQVADAIVEHLGVQGVGVLVEATHECMSCRGIKKSAIMVTSCLRGQIFENASARAEFLSIWRK